MRRCPDRKSLRSLSHVLVALLLLSATVAQAAPQTPAKSPADWVAPLERQLLLAETELDLSGVVLVAEGDRVLLRHAYGWADRALDVRNRPEYRFNLASMNKMFTALAVLRLVEQNRLSLDEPVIRWLPTYPNREVAERVTVRQLLGHTSGLGNFWEALQSRQPASVCSTKDFLDLFINDPLQDAPGKTFSYSNSGYILLGHLIETVTGETYEAHLQRTVFAPLGMHDTGSFPLDQVIAGRVSGHARSQEQPGLWLNNAYVNVFCGTAAGGGYSTVDDLFKFGRALASGKLLEPALMKQYTTGVHPYSKGRYALGLSEETIRGNRVIGHSGGHIGIAGELLVLPGSDQVVVILTNGDVDAFWNVRNRVTRALLGDDKGSEAYWRTLDLVAYAQEHGTRSGLKEAARLGGAAAISESVIDVTAGKWLHRNDVRRALALFELNAQLFPTSDDALLRLADAARVLRREALAISSYEGYLARVPGDAEAAAHLRSLKTRK